MIPLLSSQVIAARSEGDAEMDGDSGYSTLCNRYFRSVFRSALVGCGNALSRAKCVFIMQVRRIYGKEILLFSAIAIAGPDAQLFAQICVSFIGLAGGRALAYVGRSRRDPRRR